jgi:hypothetical protein
MRHHNAECHNRHNHRRENCIKSHTDSINSEQVPLGAFCGHDAEP